MINKLKAVLELVWSCLATTPCKGIVLAYDEAQNLGDQAERNQYPLSLLLDVFQSIQKKGLPILLVLTGLPTLFPKLVEARTFAERMFHVVTLGRLNEDECRQAITIPVKAKHCPVTITEPAIVAITKNSGGYPYFVQFLCREIYDSYLQQRASGVMDPVVTVAQVVRILDETEEVEATNAKAVGADFRPSLASPYRWRDWAAPGAIERKRMVESTTRRRVPA